MKFEDLTVCAFRYSLGRESYIVSDMIEHLDEHWYEICPAFQKLIKKEIHEALEDRKCGMQMDCDAWRDLLQRLKARTPDEVPVRR